MPPTQHESERRALLVLLAGVLALCALVFWPMAQAIFLAGVLAAAIDPLYRRVNRWVGGRSWIAGGLMVLGVTLLVLGPLVSLTVYVVGEATEAGRYVVSTLKSEGVEGLLSDLPDPLERAVRSVLDRLSLEPGTDLSETLKRGVMAGGGAAASAVGSAVSATGALVFQGAMMLIALYFLLTEKEQALQFVQRTSPLGSGRTRELLREFRQVTVAVLRSSVLTALAQALVAVPGYVIAGAPRPVFFGALTFFVALIPAVGAAAVVLFVALLLLIGGHIGAAIFLAIWGLFVVGLVDNLLKPILIKGGVELHGAVVFFALLGGLAAFGAIGLLIGPLVVALLLAVLRIYRRDFAPTADSPEAQ